MSQVLSKSPFIPTGIPLIAAMLFGSMVAVSAMPTMAAAFTEQQQLVDKAKLTVEAFTADPSAGGAVRDRIPCLIERAMSFNHRVCMWTWSRGAIMP
jgi:hypothetical protein